MVNIAAVLNAIKESVLKFVSAKSIYLFGSHAYGSPSEESDIDIYVVTPNGTTDFPHLYTKIMVDLSYKKIFFVDLLLSTENDFNTRRVNRRFEKTIHQKGRILYEQ